MKNPNPPPFPDEIVCQEPVWPSDAPCGHRAFLVAGRAKHPGCYWYYCIDCHIAGRQGWHRAEDAR